jgi:hypothetical protein
MDTTTYTTLQAKLASAMDHVCNDHEPLIITRNGEQSAHNALVGRLQALGGNHLSLTHTG